MRTNPTFDECIGDLSLIKNSGSLPYGLLEAGGDEEADDDGGDVDEEVAPGVGRGVGRVGFEHAWLRAVGCPVIPYLEIAVRGGWATRCAEEAGTLW